MIEYKYYYAVRLSELSTFMITLTIVNIILLKIPISKLQANIKIVCTNI